MARQEEYEAGKTRKDESSSHSRFISAGSYCQKKTGGRRECSKSGSLTTCGRVQRIAWQDLWTRYQMVGTTGRHSDLLALLITILSVAQRCRIPSRKTYHDPTHLSQVFRQYSLHRSVRWWVPGLHPQCFNVDFGH